MAQAILPFEVWKGYLRKDCEGLTSCKNSTASVNTCFGSYGSEDSTQPCRQSWTTEKATTKSL